MRTILLLLAAALCLPAADTIEAFGLKWTVPKASDWAVEGTGDSQVLKMLVPVPLMEPRRPRQYALADTPPFEEVTLDAEVKRNGRSLLLICAYKDETHMDYAHLSLDTGMKQPVHNGIFHVFGGERVRISSQEGPNALPTEDWTPVRLVYSARTGLIEVTVNGQKNKSLRAYDLSLGAGRVGLGSFNETAQFRKVRIQGR
jgi:hypothetical protein